MDLRSVLGLGLGFGIENLNYALFGITNLQE